ncbi:hypothetical protein VNO78_25857 [Psophocarpus tetragonolobus]|uniref:Uncharacterized protein n=1 Tax=Psophocarpus tetragonolobus TaxID=3891 RepID=A0AAN9SAI0_PSOTE
MTPYANRWRDVQQADVTDTYVKQTKHGARDTDFENDVVQQNGHRNPTVVFGPDVTVGMQKAAQIDGSCGSQLELSRGNRASSVGRQPEAQLGALCGFKPFLSMGWANEDWAGATNSVAKDGKGLGSGGDLGVDRV